MGCIHSSLPEGQHQRQRRSADGSEDEEEAIKVPRATRRTTTAAEQRRSRLVMMELNEIQEEINVINALEAERNQMLLPSFLQAVTNRHTAFSQADRVYQLRVPLDPSLTFAQLWDEITRDDRCGKSIWVNGSVAIVYSCFDLVSYEKHLWYDIGFQRSRGWGHGDVDLFVHCKSAGDGSADVNIRRGLAYIVDKLLEYDQLNRLHISKSFTHDPREKVLLSLTPDSILKLTRLSRQREEEGFVSIKHLQLDMDIQLVLACVHGGHQVQTVNCELYKPAQPRRFDRESIRMEANRLYKVAMTLCDNVHHDSTQSQDDEDGNRGGSDILSDNSINHLSLSTNPTPKATMTARTMVLLRVLEHAPALGYSALSQLSIVFELLQTEDVLKAISSPRCRGRH